MRPSFFGRLFSASAIVAAALASVPAHAGPFSNMFVFGDSVSDSGNNSIALQQYPSNVVTGNSYIPTFPYAPAPFGTYSNGPVWASYFASMIGVPLAPSLLGGTNYAFGGARTGPAGSPFPYSLLTQTQQFLGTYSGGAPANALYVVEGGANNARDAISAIFGGANLLATAHAAATTFAADVGTMVDELQAAGAKHIVVWNTPDLGVVPAVAAGGPVAEFVGSFVAQAMNNALAHRLAGEAGVATFDIYGLSAAAAADPGAFGFTNATDACGALPGANCDQYFYWDGIHPTTAADRVIADEFAAVAMSVPEPETYALFAVGLVAVALQGRRRVKRAAVSA